MPGGAARLREVRERDYFFIVGFSVWGLWAGVGIAALWSRLAAAANRGLLRAAPVLGLALLPLVLNWSWASRRSDFSVRDYAYNMLMSVEPYGVLITGGDNDTFPLWYLQEVEGIRRDVIVVVAEYLNAPWYLKQLRNLSRPCAADADPDARPTQILCQRAYQPGDGVYSLASNTAGADVAIAAPPPMAAPSRAITTLDDGAIDGVNGLVRMDRAQTLQLGPVRADLREGQVLWPRHILSLNIINDSVADRPIHFTGVATAEELGVSDNLVRHGLTLRLNPGPVSGSDSNRFERMPDDLARLVGRWVDVERTRALLEDAFVHRAGLPDWNVWKDQPSSSIPFSYAVGYLGLAESAAQRGEVEDSVRYRAEADRWLALSNW